MPQTIRLVTRADDLGSFRSANRAILEVYRHGIVRNASLLAIGHELDDAIRLLSDVDGLCVGCHASITSEWENVRWSPCAPAARIPALLDAHGHLVRHPREAAEQGADPEQVLLEVAAQLARLRALGVEPEYLDTHMRFDLLPGVADALDDFCRRESLLYASRVPDLARLARPAGLGRAGAVVAARRDAEPGRDRLIGHPACASRRGPPRRSRAGRHRRRARRRAADVLGAGGPGGRRRTGHRADPVRRRLSVRPRIAPGRAEASVAQPWEATPDDPQTDRPRP